MHGILDYDTFVEQGAIVFTGSSSLPIVGTMIYNSSINFKRRSPTVKVPNGRRLSPNCFYRRGRHRQKSLCQSGDHARVRRELGFPYVPVRMVALQMQRATQALARNQCRASKSRRAGAQIKLPTKLRPNGLGLRLQKRWPTRETSPLHRRSRSTLRVKSENSQPYLRRFYAVHLHAGKLRHAGDRRAGGIATIARTDGSTEDALLVLTNNSEFFYLLSGENEVVFLEESSSLPSITRRIAVFYGRTRGFNFKNYTQSTFSIAKTRRLAKFLIHGTWISNWRWAAKDTVNSRLPLASPRRNGELQKHNPVEIYRVNQRPHRRAKWVGYIKRCASWTKTTSRSDATVFTAFEKRSVSRSFTNWEAAR